MECQWIKVSPSLQKGVDIINNLDSSKFEQFLKRIITKLKIQDSEIFTQEEKLKLEQIFKIDEANLVIVIRTVIYLWKRILKFVFKPVKLKDDLCLIGLSEEKSNFFLKVWSIETRDVLDNLNKENISFISDSPAISWSVNIELSSGYNKKEKVPKAYLFLLNENQELTEIEMRHSEIYSTFLQFEAIQAELDTVI